MLPRSSSHYIFQRTVAVMESLWSFLGWRTQRPGRPDPLSSSSQERPDPPSHGSGIAAREGGNETPSPKLLRDTGLVTPSLHLGDQETVSLSSSSANYHDVSSPSDNSADGVPTATRKAEAKMEPGASDDDSSDYDYKTSDDEDPTSSHKSASNKKRMRSLKDDRRDDGLPRKKSKRMGEEEADSSSDSFCSPSAVERENGAAVLRSIIAPLKKAYADASEAEKSYIIRKILRTIQRQGIYIYRKEDRLFQPFDGEKGKTLYTQIERAICHSS